jgi:hypothetical protein
MFNSGKLMNDRARVLTTWILVALTTLWSVGLDECLGLVDCCKVNTTPAGSPAGSSTGSSDTPAAPKGCCATKAARDALAARRPARRPALAARIVERSSQRERSGSRQLCACASRSSASAPVSAAELFCTIPSVEIVLALPVSRASADEAPRASPRSSIWSPLQARAPPGATGLS